MNNKTFNYLTIIIILVAFPVIIVKYFRDGNPVTVYSYIGLALMIPSLILLIIARIQLGSSFQISAKANKLVTKGLYKKLRHPVYYSGIPMILGIGIFMHQPVFFILCVAVILLQLKRIKNEEKVLEEKFGSEYVEYKKSTWF